MCSSKSVLLLLLCSLLINNGSTSSINIPSTSSEITSTKTNSTKFFFNNIFSFLTTTTPSNLLVATEEVPEVCVPCQCGIPNIISTKIVNGVETGINYYPWVVYITYRELFYTGAVIVSSRYVLTAAHSGNIQNLRNLKVVFLDHHRHLSATKNTLAFSRKVTKIIMHKYYNIPVKYNNDIALVKLDAPINFPHEFLSSVCLPDVDISFSGNTGSVLGWGAGSEFGAFSEVLREAQVPIWSNENCIENTSYGKNITENMLCAGVKEGGNDACKGDSGGPLQTQNEQNLYTLIGIVSWGNGCGQPNTPGIYTRISKYLEWIRENIKDSCYCS